MARIRTVKPEFFTSESIVELTPLARLFFVSLWCEADREGRLIWKPKTLKLRYFPADDCDILAFAEELISGGLMVPYEVDGTQYMEIPGFKKHQIINNREAESILPPRVKDASSTRQPRKLGVNSPTQTEEIDASSTRESGVLGEGKGTRDTSRQRFSPPTLNEVKSYCDERGRGVDSERWMNHYQSNGWMVGKNKMKDWKAAVRKWEEKPVDPPMPKLEPMGCDEDFK